VNVTDEPPISRRDLLRGRFFRKLTGHVSEAVGRRLDIAAEPFRDLSTPARTQAMLPVLHRPPCAVDEITFTAQCTRCDACVRACPVDAIVHADALFGKAAGTPIIEPRSKACVMCEDLPCVAACVAEGTSVLNPKLAPKMGTARIIKPSCLAYRGQACDACVRACPVEGAIEIRRGLPVVHEDACTGCGMCQQACPAPRKAVAIIATSERPAMPETPNDDQPNQE